ncbi:MAG: hypothetical protein ACRDRS_10510 [Pseudonocardiaceae bacterium]
MSGPPRWGMSLLDCRAHAVDEDAEHPYGVWVARCGQRLLRGTSLHDEPPPGGWMCLPCLRWADRGNPGESEVPKP